MHADRIGSSVRLRLAARQSITSPAGVPGNDARSA